MAVSTAMNDFSMSRLHGYDDKNELPFMYQPSYIATVANDHSYNRKESAMPLYIDIHKHVPGLTAEGASGAHARDLEVQKKHGVEYLKYWYDEDSGKVFCLAKAPSKEAAAAVHREAHGLMADEIIEVREGE